MNIPKWPGLRLPDGNNSENGIVLELPSPSRFSMTRARERPGSREYNSATIPHKSSLDFSEEEDGGLLNLEGESGSESEDLAMATATAVSTSATPGVRQSTHHFQNTPHFSRTMSMPLPSQLSHLHHPHRPLPRTVHSSPNTHVDTSSSMGSLSVDLADVFQMVIQTMLQISPPQVLESAKEQYSACSLSVPTPSMSAMFTAMKTLNYLSANLLRFYSDSSSVGYADGESKVQNVFDIGELLQGIGDTLSGVAAQAGIDLVLYHGDVGLRHVYVKGDECGISYALLHILRQILDKAQPGDLIQLGLVVTPHGVRSGTPSLREEGTEGRITASPVDTESLRCTIKIEHRYGAGASGDSHDSQEDQGSNEGGKMRTNPKFTTLLLRRILRLIDAQFTIADNVENGQTYEVGLILNKTASPASKTPIPLSGSGILEEPSGSDAEPTVEQLLAFGETLKGRKVTLYSNSACAFARHITSYLTAWGMDVSHVSPDGALENPVGENVSTPLPEARFPPPASPTNISSEATGTSTPRNGGTENQPQLSFVLIDDDVGILRERLHALRVEQYPLNLNARARPSLLHRPKSSPQVARVLAQSSAARPAPVIVLHFTSLANFKAAKDVIQAVMSTFTGSAVPLPEVMIIPKPVGPRRFLTAIHTAVTRPIIDPFFSPTATSPTSPGGQLPGSFFPAPSDPSATNQSPPSGSPYNRTPRPHGSRSNSDRSTKDHVLVNLPSPSPLGIPDNVEYFPDPAGKLGPSLSSGYLVSSPDGLPAGILFHPRSKKNASPQPVEKGGSQMNLPLQRRGSVPRGLPGGEMDMITFSTLHEVSQVATEAKAVVSPKIGGRDGTLTPGKRSPPESPRGENSPSWKALGKRPAHEKQDSVGSAGKGAAAANKKGKGTSPADGNIMPPISVLIVDDNPINQTILSTFMKRKKIRYDIANDGKEAVEKWKTGGFHLILMDIQMPIMDGIEATREIRRLEELNAVSGYPPMTPSAQTSTDVTTLSTSTNTSSPYRSSVIIVALTASSLQSDRVSALAAGCNDFLTKPVSLLWLNNKIIEWGSIKALQMWADIKPEAVKKISRGQAAQARAIADKLQVPKRRKSPSRNPPAGDRTKPTSSPANSPSDATTTKAVEEPGVIPATTGEGLNHTTNALDSAARTDSNSLSPMLSRQPEKKKDIPEQGQGLGASDTVDLYDDLCTKSVQVAGGAAIEPLGREDIGTVARAPEVGSEDTSIPKPQLPQNKTDGPEAEGKVQQPKSTSPVRPAVIRPR